MSSKNVNVTSVGNIHPIYVTNALVSHTLLQMDLIRIWRGINKDFTCVFMSTAVIQAEIDTNEEYKNTQ